MLPRAQRLTIREFETAFASARILRHPLLQLRVFRRGDDNEAVRAAFVAPKKLGGAVIRNRLRRRVRERYRLHPLRKDEDWQRRMQNYDLIFLISPPALTASYETIDEALEQLLKRAQSHSK